MHVEEKRIDVKGCLHQNSFLSLISQHPANTAMAALGAMGAAIFGAAAAGCVCVCKSKKKTFDLNVELGTGSLMKAEFFAATTTPLRPLQGLIDLSRFTADGFCVSRVTLRSANIKNAPTDLSLSLIQSASKDAPVVAELKSLPIPSALPETASLSIPADFGGAQFCEDTVLFEAPEGAALCNVRWLGLRCAFNISEAAKSAYATYTRSSSSLRTGSAEPVIVRIAIRVELCDQPPELCMVGGSGSRALAGAGAGAGAAPPPSSSSSPPSLGYMGGGGGGRAPPASFLSPTPSSAYPPQFYGGGGGGGGGGGYGAAMPWSFGVDK